MIIYKLSEMSSDDRLTNMEEKMDFIISNLLKVKKCCKNYMKYPMKDKVMCVNCHMKICLQCANKCKCGTFTCDDCPGASLKRDYSFILICKQCREDNIPDYNSD